MSCDDEASVAKVAESAGEGRRGGKGIDHIAVVVGGDGCKGYL